MLVSTPIPRPWRACLLGRLSARLRQLYRHRACLVDVGIWKFCLICRTKFIACWPCSRRYKYCSTACSQLARRSKQKKSNRSYRKAQPARRLQSRRQSRYRNRRAKQLVEKRVTDQSSPRTPEIVEPLPKEIIEETKSDKPSALSSRFGIRRFVKPSHCFYCGRGPLWLPTVSGGQLYKDSS